MVRSTLWTLLITLGLLAFATPSAADENRFPFQEGDQLAGSVPSPDEFYGAPLGTRFTPHSEMLTYLRALAEKSDRIAVEPYGVTPEGRELVLCFIGSPDTLGRLDEIRGLQAQLADPRSREGNDPLDSLLAQLPAVLWLSYNVHGNEASASEAALWTTYQLVDGTDAASAEIREKALVILDPCLNPDGRDRYQSWFRSVRTRDGDPDPRSREHIEPWPGGRSNHYLFDLNRDWAWQSQPETEARIAQFIRWWPLIHVDFHEMSPESTYFFFPPTTPINENVSKITLDWGETIGRANAGAFDRFGWTYYTGEDFDLFYPAYGDSWPSLVGSVGMTYEQGGSSRAGVVYRRRDGSLLTLSDRLHHHHVAGMATLLASVKEKERLQNDFFRFRQDTIERGRTGDVLEFLFPPQSGGRLEELIALLKAQGIEVRALAQEVIAEDLRDYNGEKHEVTKLPAGTLSVQLDQPCGRLARALLEPEAKASDAYFYDVSAWCLPMAMGVDGYVASTPFSAFRIPASLDPPVGSVDGQGKVGYLLEWEGLPAVRALGQLHQRGVPVHLIPEEVKAAGRTIAAGSLFVRARSDEHHAAVRAVADECAVSFVGVHSLWTDEGIDLGSDRVARLRAPRLAVISGEGVSSRSFGAAWSLLERRVDYPFSAVPLRVLGSSGLEDYDVVVIPSGARLRSALGESQREELERWVRAGGVLVAIGSSAFELGADGIELVGRKAHARRSPRTEENENRARKTLARLREERERNQVPGNIFRISLDPEHPLAFGHASEMFAFLDGTRTFATAGDGGDVAAFPREPAASGFISKENEKKIERGVYLAEERVGRGRVILFADDPNFRGFWRGSNGLFLNALFLRSTW